MSFVAATVTDASCDGEEKRGKDRLLIILKMTNPKRADKHLSQVMTRDR